jgi:hypothetical protein
MEIQIPLNISSFVKDDTKNIQLNNLSIENKLNNIKPITSIDEYLNEFNYVKSNKELTSLKILYEEFNNWQIENKKSIINKKIFITELKNAGFNLINKSGIQIYIKSGPNIKILKNIKILIYEQIKIIENLVDFDILEFFYSQNKINHDLGEKLMTQLDNICEKIKDENKYLINLNLTSKINIPKIPLNETQLIFIYYQLNHYLHLLNLLNIYL